MNWPVYHMNPSLASTVFLSAGIKGAVRLRVGPFTQILAADIGDDVQVGHNVFIGNGVVIGHRCNIQGNVTIPVGVVIGDDVFIAGDTCFCNDKHPRVRKVGEAKWPGPVLNTVVENHVSIGANCTILPGVRLGYGCRIGAGSVVTGDIPSHAVAHGNPARWRLDVPRVDDF